ncbi:ATP-binding protein [Domibacillus epiphyticus]|uniref:histidine kinase n=1 Tax=Domibacillus epiphyticus TaxID=1714355 RepID=A0A1V2A7Z2_9BACI|nr:sensor histidine kinase [Domibacillus epiphyticus]OMP66934.1 two-component sensor histidine kinase [Domibacillus epiphyticus]
MSTILDNLQTILLTIFLVYFCFSIFFKYIERRTNKITNEIIIALVSGISIVLCMTFSITLPTGYTFDFRQVPFIVGALYGGHRVAVFLLSILLFYRFFLDVPGIELSLTIYLMLVLSLWFIIPMFHKTVNIRKKIYLAILASFFGLFYRMTVAIIFHPANFTLDCVGFFISSLIIQSIGIFFFVFFNEKSRKDAILAKEIGKLEKLRTVSDIAASISHEVRNPLTVTRGFIQLLRDPNLTDKEKNRYIDTAVVALDQAESTISDYLTFAKPTLEHINILDLKKELAYTLKIVEPFATLNDVHIIELCQDTNVYIAGEEQKMHQCLVNLIKNAVEAMPHGGKLTIRLKEQNGKAVITVTDTGTGMTDEQIERLGTPYFSTKEKGTGLGTMVVYSIVKAMRGEIKVESEIGKGTSFSIMIPTTKPFPSLNEKIVSYS